MAVRLGRCTNFANCTIADTKQIVQVPEGSDLVCPECKSTLKEVKKPPNGTPVPPWLVALVAILVVLGGLWYLWRKIFPPPPPPPHSAALRLCGSNTIGAQLAPALISAFLKQDGATDVKVTPTATDEVSVTGSRSGNSAPQMITIQAHGTGTAFEGLSGGACDIGMASRKIKDTEAQSLASLGDMTSPASEHVLGLDGIAVIVNRANPVGALTVQQIGALFSGSTNSWSAVSGRSAPVKVFARDDKSGTYDTFKSLVLGSKKSTGDAQRFEDSRALSDAVAGDPNGVGFIGLPYIGSAKAVAVSEPGARALVPNRFTIATEDYLLSRRLYLYTPSNPSALARQFIDFALSKTGQDIVAANGFVEQNVRVVTTPLPADATAQYKATTRGAQRLSLDFRFRTGSSQLDNKALADIDRVTSLLSDLHYSGQNVLFLGFADSTGTAGKNLVLSKDRSRAVSDQFTQRGVQPGLVTGFGAEMPVASNDTDEGRQKNRRVEIWVKK